MRQLMCYLRYPHVARDLITFAAEDGPSRPLTIFSVAFW